MNLKNTGALEEFLSRHADARNAVNAWIEKTESASWEHLLDVRKTFPTADGVLVQRGTHEVTFTIFNLKGNHYRLVTRISYELQLVHITVVLTHAEYDKNKWKNL